MNLRCMVRALLGTAILAIPLVLFPVKVNADDKVTLQLRWHHQFQFAGYYAAKEKGYYRDAGLDVSIIPGGPGREPTVQVLEDIAQYGTGNSEVLFERLHGKPLVALAAIFQHSASVLLVKRESGIVSPQGLAGHRVMTVGTEVDVGLMAMLLNEGIDPQQIKFQKTSYDINDLVKGETDAFNSYLTNEPYFMERIGVPVTVINPATYGIDFYSDILFTSEEEIMDHPERAKRFREASLDGWIYAMQNREEIIDLILDKYGSTKTRDHLRFEAETMASLILPELVEMGHINPGRIKHMADTIVRLGMVDPGYSLRGFIYDPHPSFDLEKWYLLVGVLTSALLLVTGIVVLVVNLNGRLKKEISDRMRAEDALSHAVDEAISVNRTKSWLLSELSHDLNEPLNTASILLDGLSGLVNDKKQSSLFQMARESLSSLKEMLSTVMAYSRFDSGANFPLNEEVFELSEILMALDQQFHDRAMMLGVDLKIVSSKLCVKTDRDLLYKAIEGIVRNATREARRGAILIGCRRSGRSVRIEVWYDGDRHSHERYGRLREDLVVPGTSSHMEGYGLDLSIVVSLANLMNLPITILTAETGAVCIGLELNAVSDNLPR